MTTSHTDGHDLDKLARWCKGLSSDETGRFPAYAIFLVSPEDRAAHDVFRQFRDSFDVRGAPFQHLVIFGQHGVSSTVRELVPRFGLSSGSVPVLVLCQGMCSELVYTAPLSRGGGGGDSSGNWLEVLAAVEAAADGGQHNLDMTSPPGLSVQPLGGKSLVDLAGDALRSLA